MSRHLTVAAIIPLYNGAQFIEASLGSVLSQTRLPDVIVVVDDGSTDEGPAIVQRFCDANPKIRLIHKSNGGQSSARNLGVKEECCDLIALLDQDDIWYADHVEKLIKPFLSDNRGDLGWTYSDLDIIDRDGGMVTRNLLADQKHLHPKHTIWMCLAQDMMILPSASLIRAEAFLKVGGFDERLSGYEDDDLFIRIFREGYRNVFVSDSLSKWRVHSSSTSFSPRMARSRMIFAEKLRLTFTDDLHLGHYPHRDLIVPRFWRGLLAEYVRSLRVGSRELFSKTLTDLGYFRPYLTGRRRWVARLVWPMMTTYPLAHLLYNKVPKSLVQLLLR